MHHLADEIARRFLERSRSKERAKRVAVPGAHRAVEGNEVIDDEAADEVLPAARGRHEAAARCDRHAVPLRLRVRAPVVRILELEEALALPEGSKECRGTLDR